MTKNQRTNPLSRPLESLFRRLTVLNGLLSVLDRRISCVRKQIQESIDEKKFDPRPAVFAGSHLLFHAITDFANLDTLLGPGSSFSAADNDYLDALAEILTANANRSVAQSYEAFETFLFDVAAAYLHLHQDEANQTHLQRFDDKAAHQGASRSDPVYWTRFVRRQYRGVNNEKVFALLRSFAPQLGSGEENNVHKLDFPSWYKVASVVRHAVIHSDSAVKPDGLRSLSKKEKALLKARFLGVTDSTGVCRMELNKNTAKAAIARFAEYAFFIFKCLSIEDGLDWKVLPAQT